MIKKILSKDLQVGMFVQDFNTPWVDHPFLSGPKTIDTAGDLDLVLEHGAAEVTIDTDRGIDSPRAFLPEESGSQDGALRHSLVRDTDQIVGPSGPQVVESAADVVPFDEELRKAVEVYTQAKQTVKDIYRDARLGTPCHASQVCPSYNKKGRTWTGQGGRDDRSDIAVNGRSTG